jgi:hypothetical protein
MPIPIDELSAFFDRFYLDTRHEWERLVMQGAMSDWSRQRNDLLMNEIAMILRMLAEGHATLTYVPPEQREPATTIWRPRVMED